MKFTVKIQSILDTLKKFREEHGIELAVARKTWGEKAVKAVAELEIELQDLGYKSADRAGLWGLWSDKPVDNMKEYDKLMGAMERGLEAGETVLEIDESEYDRIFNDQHGWRSFSKASNARYTS